MRSTRRRWSRRACASAGARSSPARLTAATSADALPEPELVIVACKSLDLDAVAERLAGHWPGAIVMTVQNGIGADEVISRYGDWRQLTSVTFMSGTRHEDTHVQYVLDTATWIGPSRGTTPADARAVAELIVASGLKAEAFDDLRPAQWSKLIFNATVNTVAALTGLPHDPHFAALDRPSDLGHLVRALDGRGQGGRCRRGRHARRGSVGDERPRDQTWQRALSVDARGRRGASPDRDRHDHRLARARGAPRRRPCAAARDDGTADQGEGGVLA